MSAPENNQPEHLRELEKEIQSLRQPLEKALAENQRLRQQLEGALRDWRPRVALHRRGTAAGENG